MFILIMLILQCLSYSDDQLLHSIMQHNLGARDDNNARLLYTLFHREHFRISITKDAATVEVCGAIKVDLYVWCLM